MTDKGNTYKIIGPNGHEVELTNEQFSLFWENIVQPNISRMESGPSGLQDAYSALRQLVQEDVRQPQTAGASS